MQAYTRLFVLVAYLLLMACWCSANDDLKRAKKLVDAVRTRGEPTTIDELNKQFALKKDVDDVSNLLLEGLSLLDGDSYFKAKGDLPILGALQDEPYPKPGENRPILEQAEKFVDSQSAAIAKFHEVARRGGRAFFPLRLAEKGEFESAIKEDWLIDRASELLQFDVEVKLRRNNTRGAAKSIAAMLAMNVSFDAMPGSYIFPLYGFSYSEAHYIKQALGRLTDDELVDFQSRIRQISPSRRLAFVQQLGRVGLLQRYTPLGDFRYLESELKSNDKDYAPLVEEFADYLEAKEKFVLAAKKEFPSAIKEGNESRNAFKVKWEGRQGGYPLYLYVELDCSAIDAAARETLLIQAADAGIACERYRRENKKLPTSLEALVPKFLPIVPTDPFSGKPMLFKVADEGITIYSVGRDNEDDGGDIMNFQDGDFGLRFLMK